jgi:hypothetical protein
MNTAISWLYQQFQASPPTGMLTCYLCGACCEDRYSVKAGIADTFNSHYLAACPSSPYLCAACQWYFDGKANHPDFRKMSLIVAERNWQHWRREDMKTELGLWLAHGLEADAYLVVSLSKKKHILLQAPLNTAGTKLLAIQVEEQVDRVIRDAGWGVQVKAGWRGQPSVLYATRTKIKPAEHPDVWAYRQEVAIGCLCDSRVAVASLEAVREALGDESRREHIQMLRDGKRVGSEAALEGIFEGVQS